MNASVTMQQAGQSKKMAEARLSFRGVEYYNFNTVFSFLKMYTDFKKGNIICPALLVRAVY
jgi:hypothetical protein